MDLSHTHRFAAALPDVVAMYADEDFARARAEATGAIESDVLVDGDADDAFSVAIQRVIPTESVRADVRGFIGQSITVRYTEAWNPPDGDFRDGTFAVEIVGAPARAAGSLHLAPEGDETTLTITGTIRSSALLLGGAVARAVGEALETAMQRELAAADIWLAS